MNTAKRYTLAALATAAIALPLVGAGIAQASENNGAAPTGPTTQSPTQGASAVLGTLGNTNSGFTDALNAANGNSRPDGADGVETRFPPADPRYVEGPVGGLAKNGPQG